MVHNKSLRQVADPFWSYLKQGAEPRVLARSAAVGFNIGLCPLVGEIYLNRGDLLFAAQHMITTMGFFVVTCHKR